jgi:hypothetical protein
MLALYHAHTDTLLGANKQRHVFKKDPKAPKVVGGKLLASGYWYGHVHPVPLVDVYFSFANHIIVADCLGDACY